MKNIRLSTETTGIKLDSSRRTMLTASAALGAISLAGCLDDTPDIPPVESLPRPIKGSADSEVTVAVFEDYMCSHCATFVQQVMPQLQANYIDTDIIRFEFYDYPIPVSNTLSYTAAEVARSVQKNVGMDAFWDFNTAVFDNQSSINRPADLYDLAENVGADRTTVRNEARADVYRGIVEADRETGTQMGVRGTPYVFVNGEYLENPQYARIESRIQEELSQ